MSEATTKAGLDSPLAQSSLQLTDKNLQDFNKGKADLELSDSDAAVQKINEKMKSGTMNNEEDDAEMGKLTDGLPGGLDANQLAAIQDLMVDMSLEERQKFVHQMHMQQATESLDSDLFFRQG